MNRQDLNEFMKTQKLKVTYGFDRDNPRSGGVTVVWGFPFDDTCQNSTILEVSAVYCSPKDSFNKKEGLYRALTEFSEGRTILMPLGHGERFNIPYRLRSVFWHSADFYNIPVWNR